MRKPILCVWRSHRKVSLPSSPLSQLSQSPVRHVRGQQVSQAPASLPQQMPESPRQKLPSAMHTYWNSHFTRWISDKRRQRFREIELLHCWWECKIVLLPRRQNHSFSKTKHRITIWSNDCVSQYMSKRIESRTWIEVYTSMFSHWQYS